ncbi:small multidrug efflux protein [uncultured Microbacterium sp.]|uniref:small multidrug efflux protein n=1 Tax=uncultured Microbacterium sp. TaxID=191216 RepID=UPI00261759C4|nr:small multidrug efflux protein [uncultured Microbacterium sp.]
MNLIETFQNLVAQVPELIQPLIIALAGAVPFIEGEGAVTIGIIGGINPFVAGIAAIAGNFLCVAILVLAGSHARSAVINRSRAKALVASDGSVIEVEAFEAEAVIADETARKAARREKFHAALERYGVPGVSLLGPLLLPTMFTATMLAALGVRKARVLFWQAIAIVGWTTLIGLLIGGVFSAIS